jgi:hypothetical protein
MITIKTKKVKVWVGGRKVEENDTRVHERAQTDSKLTTNDMDMDDDGNGAWRSDGESVRLIQHDAARKWKWKEPEKKENR